MTPFRDDGFKGGKDRPLHRPRLTRATEMAHLLTGEWLREGDAAIDATAGNGHDTLFLARAVGTTGRVLAFDVQEAAIEATRSRLDEARRAGEALAPVDLHRIGHEHLSRVWAAEGLPAPSAILFNLGYLPGGDKRIVTRPETTVAALRTAMSLVAPDGILTVVLYAGHGGGAEEAEAVLAWATSLDPRSHQAVHYRFLNLPNAPPALVALRRTENAS